MKQNSLHSVLNTDVRILIHRICFAVCPPRIDWPNDEKPGLDNPSNPASTYDAWCTGILWGNSVFWTSSPAWGHSSPLESNAGSFAQSDIPE